MVKEIEYVKEDCFLFGFFFQTDDWPTAMDNNLNAPWSKILVGLTVSSVTLSRTTSFKHWGLYWPKKGVRDLRQVTKKRVIYCYMYICN